MKSPILKIARECDSYDNKYSIYRQIMAIGKKNRSQSSSINNICLYKYRIFEKYIIFLFSMQQFRNVYQPILGTMLPQYIAKSVGVFYIYICKN